MGQEMKFRILKMNEAEKRIGLTLVTAEDAQELERIGGYHRQAAEATQHIEEALQAAQPAPAAAAPEAGEPTQEERKQDDQS
jgi:transcriptional accessory protein Tex/SPT6